MVNCFRFYNVMAIRKLLKGCGLERVFWWCFVGVIKFRLYSFTYYKLVNMACPDDQLRVGSFLGKFGCYVFSKLTWSHLSSCLSSTLTQLGLELSASLRRGLKIHLIYGGLIQSTSLNLIKLSPFNNCCCFLSLINDSRRFCSFS